MATSPASFLESQARSLFRRCVVCPDNDMPSCPECKEDQKCQLNSATCDNCAFMTCVDRSSIDGSSDDDKSSSGKSAAGPVAGGVIGGVIVIGLITFFVWKYCVKRRNRNANAANDWPDSQMGSEKDGGMERFSMARDNRASTHTVGSVASTVFTRASNIIQIAYIPGVTNRSVHSSQDLVPPVPPIPAVSAPQSGQSSPRLTGDDQHFFMPSDLRNSAISGFSDRNSMATTRNSVASTVYRSNAIVSPVPAQMAARGKAVPVSVKSSRNSPNISRSTTPPVPSLPGGSQQTLNTKSSIVGRVGVPRPVQITRKGSSNQSPIYELDGSGSEASYSPYMNVPDRNFDNASPQYSHHSSAFDDASSDEEYSPNSRSGAGRRLMGGKNRRSQATTIQEESPISPAELPSYRNSGVPEEALNKHKKSTSLNQIIEEAARNASRSPMHGGLGSYEQDNSHQVVSPFADSHAARTP